MNQGFLHHKTSGGTHADSSVGRHGRNATTQWSPKQKRTEAADSRRQDTRGPLESALLLRHYCAEFRHWAYGKHAIQALSLKDGVTVVNPRLRNRTQFRFLARVDRATRIATDGCSNVELVKSDAADCVFPAAAGRSSIYVCTDSGARV